MGPNLKYETTRDMDYEAYKRCTTTPQNKNKNKHCNKNTLKQ
jgi:hypothetical protein